MKKINKARQSFRALVFILGTAFPLNFNAQTGTQNPANQPIVITESFNGFTYFKVNGIWKVQDPNTLQMFNIATDRISVKFKPTVTPSQISAFESSSGLIRKKITEIDWYRYDVSTVQGSFFDIARMCASNALVQNVSINSEIIYSQNSNDPITSNAWYYNNANDRDIDMHEAWNIETGLNSQIIVAIIDSGVDWAHEDLGMGTDGYQNIYLNPGEDAWINPNDPTTGNGIDDDGNGYIDDWKGWNFYNNNNDTRLNAEHGTHTAGIVSAKTNNNKGVAGGWGGSGCKIIPCGAGPNGQTKEAEVILIFDSIGWDVLYPFMSNRTDILILRDRRVQLLNREVKLSNVLFTAQQRISIYVSYSFLTQEVTSKSTFGYHVIQKYSDDDSQNPELWTGAVHYYITKYERDPFKASAGEDKSILEGETITVTANTIQESAVYNWYDESGELIYSGSSFTATPEISKKYKLEVIADADGFKDYDSMEINVNSFYINELTPNPVNDLLTVNYHASNAELAFLMIVGSSNNYQSNNYVLNTQQSQRTIDVSQLVTGHYQVILVCNGQVVDTKALVVN